MVASLKLQSQRESKPVSPTHRAAVHVTPNGLVYVDPEELVRSTRFRVSQQKLKTLFRKITAGQK